MENNTTRGTTTNSSIQSYYTEMAEDFITAATDTATWVNETSSGGDNTTEATEYPEAGEPKLNWIWSHYLKATIFSLIILFTIIGNALVLLAVSTRANLKNSPTHCFIANLALADFLVGILVLPILATYQLTGIWYFGQDYCTIWTCIHFWLCSSSILSVCAICLDRYVGVKHPLKHYRYMCRKRVRIIIGSVWLIACCLSIIPLFAWPEPPSDDPYVCKINQQFGHVLMASVGILYIPTAVMIILYWKIYMTAVNHLSSIRRGFKNSYSKNSLGQEHEGRLRIHIGGSIAAEARSNSISCILSADGRSNSESESVRSTDCVGSNSTSTSSQEYFTAVNYNRQAKTAQKLAIVVGIFILSYFPFFTMFLIRSQDESMISTEVFNIFGWIRYLNSCLNPIIYAAMLPAFRKAFKDIIFCKKKL